MNNSKLLADTITWAASSDKQVDLPTEGLITRIDLEAYITGSGAMAAAMATFGLYRAIQNLRIQGGGGKDYFNMSGVQMGVLLHYLNLLDFPAVPQKELVATTQSIGWTIHFGSKPRDQWGRDNPHDLSAAIPADEESNLKLTWGTTASNALDDTVTLSSATMYVTVHQVLAPKDVMAALKAGIKVPISSSESYDPGATKSNLSGKRQIPTGGYVRRIAIAAQNDTAVGSNGPLFVGDQLTNVGVKLERDNSWIIDGIRTKQLQLKNPAFHGMEVVDTPNTKSPWAPAGFYCLDLRNYGDRDFGIDARRFGANDLTLGMTIGSYATGEVEQIWYDTLIDYAPRQ